MSNSYSRVWHRPSRAIAIFAGAVGFVVSIVLEHTGVPWKYSEIMFGTLILVWLLLSYFRPEWHRARFWVVLTAVITLHFWLWAYLAKRIDRFGFGLMFILVMVELILAAILITKLIPEDQQTMADYGRRW